MVSIERNEEEKVECPIDNCEEEVLKRGLYMHIFQTNDPEGEGHYSRYSIPDGLDEEDLKITDTEEVKIDYPESQNLENKWYLDTYTGKAYKGKRGLMVHLGQIAGQDNIPEDVTDKHDASDFAIVDIDGDGNVTEVLRPPSGDVPSIEPYVPWYSEEQENCIAESKIREFIEDVADSETQAVSAEVMRRELLN